MRVILIVQPGSDMFVDFISKQLLIRKAHKHNPLNKHLFGFTKVR